MIKLILVLQVALTVQFQPLSAESFVQNEQDRARIEAALPAKPYASPVKPRRLLIFTLNVGYGGHPSMAYANEAFTLMGRRTGAFETVVSNDPKVFARDSLASFDAVFFNNTVGNCFTNADLRQNLIEFVLTGGGLLGVHGTSVAFTKWPGAIEDWPEFGYLIGARGANHKDSDEHIFMKLDDPESPILHAFGSQGFDFRDEFFRPQGTYSRQRVRVLLSIDTEKCDPDKGQARGDCFRADHDYAVAWIRSYGRGRVFYCTIAHNPYVFWDQRMLSFYLGALQFALGDLKCPTTPSAKLTPAVREQEKLGWRLATDSRQEQTSTLYETAEQAGKLGLAYVTGSDAQTVGAHLLRPLSPQLTDDELQKVRLNFEGACVRMVAYKYSRPITDEAAAQNLFAFARKTGIELLILEQQTKSLGYLAGLAQLHGVRIAFRARKGADVEALAKLSREHGPQLGVALDLTDPTQFRKKPTTLLSGIKTGLFYVELPESSQNSPAIETWLSAIRSVGAKPIFSIPALDARDSVDRFDAAILKFKQP